MTERRIAKAGTDDPAEFVGGGQSGIGIGGGDPGQLYGRADHALDPGSRKVAAVGAGDPFAEENAHADGASARLLESLNFAQADHAGEFVSFADDAFSSRSAGGHGARDDVLG